MEQKVLINQLSLAYTPLSNYSFTILKTDPDVQSIIENSNLYVIAQRAELRFDNVRLNEQEETLEFEIRQHSNANVLHCKIPIFQEAIGADNSKQILIDFGSHYKETPMDAFPLNNIHGIKFYYDSNTPENFLLWISPEKFLHNYWDGEILAKVDGVIHDFTRYNIHYVGQATKQDIWERLTGHNKLQTILSLEYPITYGSLPTHEISVLLFNFSDNMQMTTFGLSSNPDEMVDALMGRNMPGKRTIFLDAEKALISAIQPKYNEELFKNYPKSRDGLYKYNYNSISYTFIDPITLVYDKGEIVGGLHFLGGDTIIVKNNKTMELLKHTSPPLLE